VPLSKSPKDIAFWYHNNVSLILNFASQKKAAWPSRAPTDCSTCSQHAHRNEEAHQCKPTGRLWSLQLRDDCGADDSKFRLKFSVAQATWQKIISSHLNRAKDKLDGAKECHVAKATEDFHAIFESQFVLDDSSAALDEHYKARK
jgi:hypothetical protein